MPKAGDKVRVICKDEEIEGILMPSENADSVMIKLGSGYNIGIDRKKIKEIKVIEALKEAKDRSAEKKKQAQQNPKLPNITILHTGGTIASKVDYRTGGVSAKFSPEEMEEKFPEIFKLANIKSKLVFQMFSEDMEPEHWQILAREVKKEVEHGAEGVIITHGTDTMQYTANALSFMLENLSKPVILVGAQRSSDRGSSDAGRNIICAVNFIVKSDFAGVAVCMHKRSGDDSCYIHKGVKVRKIHSSRRDAFRSVNVLPLAEVTKEGRIIPLNKDYEKKGKNDVVLKDKIEKKVEIVKIHPGFNYEIIKMLEEKGYKGIILEGTGLGHAQVNVLDEYTKNHERLLDTIKNTIDKGVVVVMTTQTIFGRVNMNVYSTGRDLQKAGVISGEDMMPETAFVKLSWLLGNYPNDSNKVKELMTKNLRGEITERTEYEEEFI